MLRISYFFILFFASTLTFGQVVLEKSNHDFGTLLRSSQNWMDFPISNNSDKTAYIFRVEAINGFEVKFSKKEILPGKTEYIRISYTPRQKGAFNYDLPVFVSSWSKPQSIKIKGTSTFGESGIIPCPSFDNSGEARIVNFNVEVVNLDGRPVEDADVEITPAIGEIIKLKTNEFGQITQGLFYGPYSFHIEKESSAFDTLFQVNSINDVLTVYIDYKDIEPADALPTEIIAITAPIEKVEESAPIALIENEEYPDFSISEYKPNNLVFLVDVSTSMKQDDKMELLKTSMVNLLEILRPVDRFTLIAYSTEARVLIETGNNLDKAACRQSILSLEAGGKTAGAKALKKARDASLRQFIGDGNNEVFLATDGAFNEGVDRALKEARKMKRSDVKLSVLGIKCGPFTTKQMKELVSEGDGELIIINEKKQAGNQLISQVKRSSAYSK